MLWPSKHETPKLRLNRQRCRELGGEAQWAPEPFIGPAKPPVEALTIRVTIEGEPFLRGPCAGVFKFNPWVYENCVVPYWRGE